MLDPEHEVLRDPALILRRLRRIFSGSNTSITSLACCEVIYFIELSCWLVSLVSGKIARLFCMDDDICGLFYHSGHKYR